MIDLSFLSGKNIGVVGLGKTGRSVIDALKAAYANIFAWDDQEETRADVEVTDFATLDFTTLDMIVWSPGIPHLGDAAHEIAKRAREMNVPLICDIELFCQSVKGGDIIAITGTNGKSTTTALLGHILEGFRPTAIGGNIGAPVLTLDALPDDGTYVLELSSYQLELAPSLTPRGAILLNITPDHLSRHGGLDGYIAAKENIFANASETVKPVAVIAIDTDPSKEIADRFERDGKWQVVRVSTQAKLATGFYVEAGKIYQTANGEIIDTLDLSLAPALKGVHNHENAACAYAIARMIYGYDPQKILERMNSFGGLPHRQFLVRSINGISYINDSKATNAEAAARALACMKNVYWILGGQAKEGGLSGLEDYMDRIKHAFLIGEASSEFAKFLTAAGVPYSHSGTIETAVQEAHKMAQHNRGEPGGAGIVLLSPACASWDQFKSFEHRGDVFAELVQNLPEDAS